MIRMTRKVASQSQRKGGLVLSSLLGVALLASCGGHNGNNNSGGSCNNCGPNGGTFTHNPVTADLTNAFGLLVIDQSTSSSLRIMKQHNETVLKMGLKKAPMFDLEKTHRTLLTEEKQESYRLGDKDFLFPSPTLQLADSSSSQGAAMQKIDQSTGEIKDALTQTKADNQMQGPSQTLPKLTTIAVAPTKEVYLQFEQGFLYRDVPNGTNWGDQSSGYQCQFFQVSGGTLDTLLTTAPSLDNLTCLDNTHFIWGGNQYSNGVFQFDDAGDLYYPGSIPNVNKTLLFKKPHDGSATKEVINANIQFNNFLATPDGGLFYTGQTCDSSGQCGGGQGGFFRYIAPGTNGQVIEIARDWYQFIYDTSKKTDAGDQAVFFGPNPLSASTASWQSACLFNFDPSQTDPATRITPVITCGDNINDWMNLNRDVDINGVTVNGTTVSPAYGYGYWNYTGTDRNNFDPSTAWKAEFTRRCETKNQVFAGGGSQISAIKQDSSGTVYVIGQVGLKAQGQVSCSIDFRGPHCKIGGYPVLKDSNNAAYTATTCANDAGTWVDAGNCSNGASTSANCLFPNRTWTAGYCSDPTFTTKTACEAAVTQAGHGLCSNRWYTYDPNVSANQNKTNCEASDGVWHDGSAGGTLVWRTGTCSNHQDKYETKSACEGASLTWQDNTWNGFCSSTDASDTAAATITSQQNCTPTFQTNTVHYDNVAGSICNETPTGDRSKFWMWNDETNNFAKTAVSGQYKAYGDLTGIFVVGQLNCSQVSSSSTSNNWLTEYTAFARVNANTSSLELLSLSSEKAVDLWLVNDKPYYSSFDTKLGQYLLNGLTIANQCVDPSVTTKDTCNAKTATQDAWTERQCVVGSLTTQTTCEAAGYTWQTAYPSTIITNFEAYNVADSGTDGKLYADGLNFSNNQYQFGTVDVANKVITLKNGLTGTLKTIVILPKD